MHSKAERLPIIAIGSAAEPAIAAGATLHLARPLDVERLAEAVSELVVSARNQPD